jgi:large subunit ribosomal protein L53
MLTILQNWRPATSVEMHSRFITEVSAVFNPFSPKAKTARLFLSFLPPDARQTMKVNTKLLPRASRDPSLVQVKFSEFASSANLTILTKASEDGKDMKLDPEVLGIKGVLEEVNRHSRILARQEELSGN